jgi:hypothetical protein
MGHPSASSIAVDDLERYASLPRYLFIAKGDDWIDT